MRRSDYYQSWPRYVTVAEKRRKAENAAAKMAKKGQKMCPVTLNGRTVTTTFWGKAWCEHLESFSDYANRLPRGRSYVRQGAVIHLQIESGKIEARVQGSSLYKVAIAMKPLAVKKWKKILEHCAGHIDSVMELLQGKFSSGVMKIITDQQNGLFPLPQEISLDCSCPDWADMCKHVAAVLYGVGNRLDHEPELLFKLRQVDHRELLTKAIVKPVSTRSGKSKIIDDGNLSEIFGIDIANDDDKAVKIKKSVAKPKRGKKKSR